MPRAALLFFMCLCLTLPAATQTERVGPVRLDKEGEAWAQRTLAELSLEEKVGQMLMLRAAVESIDLESAAYAKLRDQVQTLRIGGFVLTVPSEGVILKRRSAVEAANLTNQLQSESEVPLLFAADFERGVGMRFDDATLFPHAMAFSATGRPEYIQSFAQVVAREARAIGVQWNFFPIVDVNSNPANPIINVRSYGETPQQVSHLASIYVRAAHKSGLLSAAKHFPGHGSTTIDTHLAAALADPKLREIELAPYRQLIDAGADAVMVAHVLNGDAADSPASLSTQIVTGLLKDDLRFNGLVLPDALEMGAVVKAANGRAAVQAILAGHDIILMPADPAGAVREILAAVAAGEIPQERINQSVLKILRAKASVGLHRGSQVDIAKASQVLTRADHRSLAQKIADDAVTLIRDDANLLPLPLPRGGTKRAEPAYLPSEAEAPPSSLAVVIFTDDTRAEYGRILEQELRQRTPDVAVFYVDPRTAAENMEHILANTARARQVLAAAFVTPTAAKTVTVQGKSGNSVSLDDSAALLLRKLLEQSAKKLAVVSLGSPYLLADFPQMRTYLCTFSATPVSEVAAVRALYGEIAIRGEMPVTIPGTVPRGFSNPRPAGTRRAAR